MHITIIFIRIWV